MIQWIRELSSVQFWGMVGIGWLIAIGLVWALLAGSKGKEKNCGCKKH